MMSDADDATAQPGLSYDSAVSEVEAILEHLENSVVDVDHLADLVKRATYLLGFCRERLAAVHVDVEALVAELDGTPGTDPDSDPDG
jgi:exodeoxyribonuclease VII small subunit